jgi:acetyl esterase/lipase
MSDDTAAALERQVRALGASFTPAANEATRAIYRDRIDLSVAGEERHDIAYGDHARHRLDMYRPRGSALGTVVFVHGGGFVGGDKNQDGVFYVNVGRWLARHGWIAVIPTYRLAPDHPWPAGARDLASVMQWVHAPANDLAAQAGPVVVWGQSAGASHVASWLFDAAARGGGSARASAAMLMSGYYQATAPLAGGPKLYFGDDESLYAARSPLTHVAPLTMPLWLSVAELDPAVIAQHTWALARAVTLANGCNPDFHFFRGHNHVSTVQSLGSPQTDVGAEVLRFLTCVGG